jgi:hypothetical protein
MLLHLLVQTRSARKAAGAIGGTLSTGNVQRCVVFPPGSRNVDVIDSEADEVGAAVHCMVEI